MLGSYFISVLNKDGNLRLSINDFTDLSITDQKFGVGSWKITSCSESRCPFEYGDYIVVYRDGVQIYCGVLKSISESYQFQSKSWKWTASGVSFKEVLKWRVIYPSIDGENYGVMPDRNLSYTEFAEYIAYVIANIVERNFLEEFYGTDIRKLPVLNKIDILLPLTSYQIQGLTFHFENVYDVVNDLLTAANYSLLPIFNKAVGKFELYMTSGRDVSNAVVFSDDFDTLESFQHDMYVNEKKQVVMNYNSDNQDLFNGHKMWEYVTHDEIPIESDSGIDYQRKEIFVEPRKEQFDSTFDRGKLWELCEAEANSRRQFLDGYKIALNIGNSFYVYGYDKIGNDLKTSYCIGDRIGIIFQGEKYTGVVTQIEISVSYRREQIRLTVGIDQKGVYDYLYSQINEISKALSKYTASEKPL